MTPTYIIGHKNPDADSICSAIAYAAFKEARGDKGYIPARCGNSNARIDTILSRFKQPLPLYLSDVSPRVRDLMRIDVASVMETGTCADALNLVDREEVRLLPVLNEKGKVTGTISAAQLGSLFIPRPSEPRLMRQVDTSLEHVVYALRATPLNLHDPVRREKLFIRLGTMDVKTFWKVSEREKIPASQAMIIVGDREDIQRKAIEIGMRGIIVTSGLPVSPAVVDLAREKGVNLISSPYDSATTAWVVRTASTIEPVVNREVLSVHPDALAVDIKRKIASTPPGPGWVVVDDEGGLCGILTKGDLLKPVRTRLVLVDHNEMTQAVTGAEEVTITEIIDHHRLGALTTPQPILFINEPVGSTCTIIADMFRREKLAPSPEIAGLMMSGLISDTLHLNSPTSTPKDAEILLWLASIAGVNSKQLAEEIFSSGSVILAQPPDKVVRADHKVYDEGGIRFAVAQVEELGFGNFERKTRELATALQELRESEKLAFAALLITDINTQNSLLLVKGDPEIIRRISYAHVQKDEIFDLPGIVSRKKQLIPYFSSLLKELSTGS